MGPENFGTRTKKTVVPEVDQKKESKTHIYKGSGKNIIFHQPTFWGEKTCEVAII